MARLLLVAHAATRGTRAMVFGDRTALVEPDVAPAWPERAAGVLSGPEPACTATADGSGHAYQVEPALAGLDAGRWTGRTLDEVAADDPEGLSRWLSDPTATPHGGESLAELVARLGRYCDGRDWPAGVSVAVVTPMVARAMAVHAFGAPAEVVFRVDVGPAGWVQLSRQGPGWRLQQLAQAGRAVTTMLSR